MRHVYRFTILLVLLGCLFYCAHCGIWDATGGFGFALVCFLIWLGLVSLNEK